MEEQNEQQQAKKLWRQYQSQLRPSGTCPDALQLASYAERQCPEDELPNVEQHLSLCSTCLKTVTLLRDPSLGSSEVPVFVEERAKDLVPEPASLPRPTRKANRGWSWEWGFQWAAMAATCAGICVIGFNLGMAVQQTQMQIDQLVVSEMLFGLGDYTGGLSAEPQPAMRGEL